MHAVEELLANEEAVMLLGDLLDAGFSVWAQPRDGVDRFCVSPGLLVSVEMSNGIERQRDALIALVRWVSGGSDDRG